MDFAERLWTIPAERMKTEDDPEGTDFEVPLSEPAIAILKAVIPKEGASNAYVFAGQWSKDHAKPLGQNAVLHALKAIYPAMTTHGSVHFRDWAAMKHSSSAILPKWHWPTRWATKWRSLQAPDRIEKETATNGGVGSLC